MGDKLVDVDPDIYDIESVLDSVFSDQTSADSSLAEIQATASIAILTLLTKDCELRSLYKEALQKISKKRFIENFRRLLIQYCRELKAISIDDSAKEAVHYLRLKCRWLATQISVQFSAFDEDENEKMEDLIHQDPDKASQLERYFAEYEACDKKEEMGARRSDSSSDDDGGDQDFILFRQMEGFLTNSEAYTHLKDNLRKLFIHFGLWKSPNQKRCETQLSRALQPLRQPLMAFILRLHMLRVSRMQIRRTCIRLLIA
jgi:hypothetical protein